MFETYTFDNLETDETRVLDGWSYFWAALFGPLYVLIRGFPGLALAMLPASSVIGAVAFVILLMILAVVDSPLLSLVATAGVWLAALVAQSVSAIQLMRFGYVRRGWREWY